MLSRCFLDFSVGVGAFVIGLSQISSFFFCICSTCWDQSFSYIVSLDIVTSQTFLHFEHLNLISWFYFADEWTVYLQNIQTAHAPSASSQDDCPQFRMCLYVMIPIAILGALLGACCSFLCLRKKYKEKHRETNDEKKHERLEETRTAEEIYDRNARKVRLNSIDIIDPKGALWNDWWFNIKDIDL